MGFFKKLTKSIGRVAKAVAPITSFIPGPIGMASMAVTALTAASAARKAQAAPDFSTPAFGAPAFDFSQVVLPGGAMVGPGPMASPSLMLPRASAASIVPSGGFKMAFPTIAGPLASLGGLAARLGAGSLIGGAARAAVGLVRTAAGKVRGVFLASGRFISSKKGAQLAKRVGIDAAAVALGVSTVEVAEMVLADLERGRRGRGLSARDMKITRRTIGTVQRLHRQIVDACRDARVPSGRRHVHAFRHVHVRPRARLVAVK